MGISSIVFGVMAEGPVSSGRNPISKPSHLHGLAEENSRFRGGLVVKAHSLCYHSALGLRAITKRKKKQGNEGREGGTERACSFCGDRVRDGPASGGGGLQGYELARLYSG